MRDHGVNDQPAEVTQNRLAVKRKRVGQLGLIKAAIRALRANDPPELRCQIALQLLRSIRKVDKFGRLPAVDQELLIQIQHINGAWYHARWIDYYRGCLFGALIPIRSSHGKLVSELPANALRGLLQACFSKQVINIRHPENINAGVTKTSEAISDIAYGWAVSCLS